MKRKWSTFAPMVLKVRASKSPAYLFNYPNYPKILRYYLTGKKNLINTGKEHLCRKNLILFAQWMSGQKALENSVKNMFHISRKSLNVGVKGFGFSIKVFLRILPDDII